METKNPIQVSERIFRVIELLAEEGSMGLQELSTALDLNKTTVHRILNSLICMDYARQDSDSLKYSLSFKFCRIAAQILSHNSMLDLARPHLRRLARESGETVHLVQMDGTQATYIDKVEAPHNSIRMASMVGRSVPLYCSGVGKAILADMTDVQIQSIWNQSDIHPLTEYTITDFDAFLAVINKVRQNGYALDNEENERGVRCIAVSLRDFNDRAAYAISISAPKDRMNKERLSELQKLILNVKREIMQNM